MVWNCVWFNLWMYHIFVDTPCITLTFSISFPGWYYWYHHHYIPTSTNTDTMLLLTWLMSVLVALVLADDSCPSECECPNFSSQVRCGERGLTSIPDNIPKAVVHLYLHDNDISYIADDSFVGLTNPRFLYLYHNHITMVNASWFRDNHAIEYIQLHNNDISYIAGD